MNSPIFAVPEDFQVDPKLVSDLESHLAAAGVEYCFSTYVDVHGVPKAKTTPLAFLGKMAAGSELFTVGALEGMGLVGPQEDECAAVPDLDSALVCPWDKRYAYFFGHLFYHGKPYPNDSRNLLQRQVERFAERGLRFQVGMETEFYVFRYEEETGQRRSLSRDRFQGICPAYDVAQTMNSMGYLERMVKAMNDLGWEVYSFDQEGGHSQYEFDFSYADALTMSDRLVFFRLMAKQFAEQLGCLATFMPKPFANDFRSGCHFNMSIAESEGGKNLFAPEKSGNPFIERYGIPLSKLGYHFLAGVLQHAPALTAVTSPTYNSYQGFLAQGEMLDVSWAPVLVTYGRNNRSAMMRVPPNRWCVENRAPDMSVNPYLAVALHMAAGLEGIEQELDPGPPMNENLYQSSVAEWKEHGIHRLPGTLLHAIDAFEEDPLVDEVFGEMKDIYVKQKRMEWEQEFYPVSQEQLAKRLTFL
ncbi:MAG: glutamine synthetase [Verrucomicrobiota bacterium]